ALIALFSFIFGLYSIILAAKTSDGNPTQVGFGMLLFIVGVFLIKGLMVVEPNYSIVLTFFGKYMGTVRENGLQFVNPLYTKFKVSLRSQSMESTKLKVNDKLGNPIEIAAVILYEISDTYKAVFDVTNFNEYMKNQSEAAVRHLATSYPYDNIEDENAHITLRDGGDKVIEMLQIELNERLMKAGITITEARISHLAYAAEIAGAMLQRQQATAIVAARKKIVEGAVGMVEMALEMLSEKEIVVLDDDKKAAMVSNLMVVLCGEKAASPVLNTGTLY
ncbi:MAG: SPFH domain-containing protein, partial [Chitinophagia bacterium]|nr:SPFH domain-containing protein [Chitinophagia bacterium]